VVNATDGKRGHGSDGGCRRQFVALAVFAGEQGVCRFVADELLGIAVELQGSAEGNRILVQINAVVTQVHQRAFQRRLVIVQTIELRQCFAQLALRDSVVFT
jgi:hypothetical protein